MNNQTFEECISGCDMKRIYPFQNPKVRRNRDGFAQCEHTKYPVPCVIGQEIVRGGKKKDLWLAMVGTLCALKTRNEATVCQRQETVEAIINYASGFNGYTKVFVEPLGNTLK